MPSIRNFRNHFVELTENLETRIHQVNNGKTPLFFDLMVICTYFLIVWRIPLVFHERKGLLPFRICVKADPGPGLQPQFCWNAFCPRRAQSAINKGGKHFITSESHKNKQNLIEYLSCTCKIFSYVIFSDEK